MSDVIQTAADAATPKVNPERSTAPKMSPERAAELKGILAEEAAEIIQECALIIQDISKGVRFGVDSQHPTNQSLGTPSERLHDELGDLLCVMKLLVAGKKLDMDQILARAVWKRDKVVANLKTAP